MECEQLTLHIREIKESFDKSYKCESQNRVKQDETINQHAEILVDEARILVHENREILNKTNWSEISILLIKLRSNLITIKERYCLDISIPTILNTALKMDTNEEKKLKIDSKEDEDSESSEKRNIYTI